MIKRILKVISVISLLLTSGMQDVQPPAFASVLMLPILFYQGLGYDDFGNTYGYGILFSLFTGNLMVYFLCTSNKDKYPFLLCFFALLLAVMCVTGVLGPAHVRPISLYFIVPLSIFIVNSLVIAKILFTRNKPIY